VGGNVRLCQDTNRPAGLCGFGGVALLGLCGFGRFAMLGLRGWGGLAFLGFGGFTRLGLGTCEIPYAVEAAQESTKVDSLKIK
jgi:hypothetical protein